MPSTPPPFVSQIVDSSSQGYIRNIMDEWLHCTMMHDTIKELYGSYAYPFLPPMLSVQVDILQTDDAILEKLGAWNELPKSSEKRIATWFL